MSSRLSCCGSSNTSTQTWIDFPVGPSSSANLALALKDEFNKIEIEYAMVVDDEDKMEVGRITLIWDKIETVKTSHEQEDSPNLGTLDNVIITPWHSATEFGVTIINNYGDALDFKYLVMNKILLPFTLPPAPPIEQLVGGGFTYSINIGVNPNATFGQTFTVVGGSGNIDKINFPLQRAVGTGISQFDAVIEIYDSPLGTLLGTSDVKTINEVVPVVTTLYEFVFSSNIPVSISTQYYFRFRIINVYIGTQTLSTQTAPDVYAGGEFYNDDVVTVSDGIFRITFR